MTTNMTAVETSDAELVSRSLAGDRDAFSQIVSRYQILICSLAYSRIGHLGQSEDVAQETFITAWKHLRLLREPEKLRAWLCGILRNRANKCLDREKRQPSHQAETLESADESPAPEDLPSEQTIGREEEAILWRSLEKIPELYREPLILYYREHQSIEHVAVELELSEDAVKQRLSRGRKLLQEEVMSFVENTLRRTAPATEFSEAVLSALPLTGPPMLASAATAGKGTAMAKSGLLGWLLTPLIGIIGGIVAHTLIVNASPFSRERRIKKIGFISLWVFVLAWCIGGQLALSAWSQSHGWSDQLFLGVMAGYWWFYAAAVGTLTIVMMRRILAVRVENEKNATPPDRAVRPLTVAKRIIMMTGIYLACFSWLINLAWRADDQLFTAILTALMIGLGGWHYFRLHNTLSASTVMRSVMTQLGIVWGVILLVLNLRLETWLAASYQTDLYGLHQSLPAPVIPLLTLALLVWAGAVMFVTRPKQSQPAA